MDTRRTTSRTAIAGIGLVLVAGALLVAGVAVMWADDSPDAAALSADARNAATTVTDQLMADCYGRAAAIDLVKSSMVAASATGFTVRTDGPFAYPMDQADAVRRHVADGCYVYSGTGTDANGSRVFYLSGPQ